MKDINRIFTLNMTLQFSLSSLIGEKKIVVFELLPQIVVTLCEIRPLKILGADQRDAYCRNLANETSNSR